MEERKLRIYISILFLCGGLFFIGCSGNNHVKVEVLTGYDYDSTYCIMNVCSNEIIYDGGHNKLQLDTIIGANYIFIEELFTEECSDRIVIFNSRQNNILRAYNLGWCFAMREQDIDRLLDGNVIKVFSIDKLDLKNKLVQIKFFNDSIAELPLTEYTVNVKSIPDQN